MKNIRKTIKDIVEEPNYFCSKLCVSEKTKRLLIFFVLKKERKDYLNDQEQITIIFYNNKDVSLIYGSAIFSNPIFLSKEEKLYISKKFEPLLKKVRKKFIKDKDLNKKLRDAVKIINNLKQNEKKKI